MSDKNKLSYRNSLGDPIITILQKTGALHLLAIFVLDNVPTSFIQKIIFEIGTRLRAHGTWVAAVLSH